MSEQRILEFKPADARATALVKRFRTLQHQRSTWEEHWQQIADYIVPRKADVVKSRSPGDKRQELVFDGTAIHAAELMAASLHGMLTNASVPWFSLRFIGAEMNEEDEAKEWLESVEEMMYVYMARSNFQEQVHELYSDLVTFGTACMFVDADENDEGLRFSTRHIAECYLSEDPRGRVDTVFRKYKVTARSAETMFGHENLTRRMAKIAKEDPYEEIELLHIVMPRNERDPGKNDATNKPFASVHVDPDEKVILGESGYDEFPYMVPRYLKASFERGYGRSPSMTALADTKMVNKMAEVEIRASQLQIHPPLQVPDDGFVLPVRTTPGGLNFYRSGTRDRIEPLNIGANNPISQQQQEIRRQMIRAAFYVDQLLLGQGPTMTATEVIQRTEEKMRLLGPVLGRLQAELLQPLINRVYNLLVRQKAFAPAPDLLANQSIEIEYVSPLAKAQRGGDINSVVQIMEFMGPLLQIDPSVADFLDIDGIARHVIKVTGLPATAVRGQAEIMELREQRAQMQAQQAQMQQMAMMAESAGAAAPGLRAVDDTNVGQQLINAAQGAPQEAGTEDLPAEEELPEE